MQSKILKKKLKLRRDVLVNLTATDLSVVGGGLMGVETSTCTISSACPDPVVKSPRIILGVRG